MKMMILMTHRLLYTGKLTEEKLQHENQFQNFSMLLQRGRIPRPWADFIADKIPLELAQPFIRDTLDDLLFVNRDKGEFLAWNKELIVKDKYKANTYVRRGLMKIIQNNQVPRKWYMTIYEALSAMDINEFIINTGL